MGLGIGVVLALTGLLLASGVLDLPGVLGSRSFDFGLAVAGAAAALVAVVAQTARNRRRDTGR